MRICSPAFLRLEAGIIGISAFILVVGFGKWDADLVLSLFLRWAWEIHSSSVGALIGKIH